MEVNKVLAEIGADRVSQLLVWNKIDASGGAAGADHDECGNIARVRLSARTGEGLDYLRQALIEAAASKAESRQRANPAEHHADVT